MSPDRALVLSRYLLSTTEIDNDSKKIKFYTYGARTYKEVGKPQILNFVCKVPCASSRVVGLVAGLSSLGDRLTNLLWPSQLITGRPPTDTQLDEVLMEDK